MASTKPTNSSLRLRVPKGFFSLMEVFVRALLKNKPLDVFEYGALFFESLLHIRTKTGHDPAIHGARSEDGFIDIHDKNAKGKKHRHKNSASAWPDFTRGNDVGQRDAREHGSILKDTDAGERGRIIKDTNEDPDEDPDEDTLTLPGETGI